MKVFNVTRGEHYHYPSQERLCFYAYHFGAHIWDWRRLRAWSDYWPEQFIK